MNCGNQHVTCQILYMSCEAFSKKLVQVYVILSLQEKKSLASNNFIQWRKDQVNNPNYILLYDLTFTIVLKRNNSSQASAGKQKVSPIMFWNYHIYKSLIVNDLKIRVQAPKEVAGYISRNESFSRSVDTLCGEGGDYVTENKNRHLKSHLPPRVPILQR